ncbi:hypothetical protein [Micromonospora sp. C95]|uniref:hypothetical protein n=1 Tax=Micromonospora sp. C95 TaxID=2824882 RepID=UPI001B387163|nr:hypothetical protein [Micromonospora sp. C95]MBQ1027938.1 hypothetical protein [Micromonospora sp. C95]
MEPRARPQGIIAESADLGTTNVMIFFNGVSARMLHRRSYRRKAEVGTGRPAERDKQVRKSASEHGTRVSTAKRIAVSLTLALTSTLGVVAVTASPAHALPKNCNGTPGTATYGVMCRGGTGFYRAWTECKHVNSGTKKHAYGNGVGIGGYSKANCGSNYRITKNRGVTKSNYLPPNW